MSNGHRCYGYLINGTFRTKSEMSLYFIDVEKISRTLYGHLEIWNFSSRVEKYSIRSLSSSAKHSSTLEEKFLITLRTGMYPLNFDSGISI